MQRIVVSFVILVATGGTLCSATDWPQWRGPNRDGVCTETGLLKTWPEQGPKLLWDMNGLGTGFATVSIAQGRLYTMGDLKEANDNESAQYVLAIDLAGRKRLWRSPVGPAHKDGPRGQPTVDGNRVYALGTDGDVVCVAADTGKIVWKKNLQKDLKGGSNITWKYSESPLVDGPWLLCTPGGPKATVVALAKETGDPVWECETPNLGPVGMDQTGYSSIVISHGAGVKQYVQLTNKGLVGIKADTGQFLWGYNKIANRAASIPTPVVWDDFVFCSNAYDTGSALLKMSKTDQGVKAEEAYFLSAKVFGNHHGGFVKVGDYIYGGQGQNGGKPTCIEAATGRICWQVEAVGGRSAAVLYADGHLIFRYEDNVVALIEANPSRFAVTGKFTMPKKPGMDNAGWPHPVISDGRLYLRHADVLLCYDVRGQ